MSPTRVLLAKPGLDGHDRGIKVIAMALRDAGVEVIYLGLRRTVTEIWRAAADEDVDVVGVSVLSGAHVPLARELLGARASQRLDIPVVIGGTVPATDVRTLLDLGVAAVFPVGTSLVEAVDGTLAVAGEQATR